MAEGGLLVTISGAALSLLFFDNVRSVGDQMGFLLGEALEFIVKTYTDSDNQVETIKIHMNVETIVTCPLPDILQDSTSRINKEKLKDFICDKGKHVIGWFRFRRHTTNLIPTMKDKLLHKQFASYFSGENGCKEELFLTCLLNASNSEIGGTHKFKHVFFRRKRGVFEPISLRINNLGDDATRHDGSDYKPAPIRKSLNALDSFSEVIAPLNLDLTKLGGLASAMTIQKAAEVYLSSLISEVSESDLEVDELERQMRQLKAQLVKERSVKVQINGTIGRLEQDSQNLKGRSSSSNSSDFPSQENESSKAHDDIRMPREHVSPSATQPAISHQKTHRNTAASIANSVNQDKCHKMDSSPEKSPTIGQNPLVSIASETKMDIDEATTTTTATTTMSPSLNRGVRSITSMSICEESSELSKGGKGRGKASEYISGTKRVGRVSGGLDNLYGDGWGLSPDQSYADDVVANFPASRSYNQATRKDGHDAGRSEGVKSPATRKARI